MAGGDSDNDHAVPELRLGDDRGGDAGTLRPCVVDLALVSLLTIVGLGRALAVSDVISGSATLTSILEAYRDKQWSESGTPAWMDK